jgi:hypothetical protein
MDEYDPDAISDLLEKNGIQLDDPRLQTSEVSTHSLIRNCINGNLIIPDFEALKRDIYQLFD